MFLTLERVTRCMPQSFLSYEDNIVKAKGNKCKYTQGISGNSVEYYLFNTRQSYQIYPSKLPMKTTFLKPKETSVSIDRFRLRNDLPVLVSHFSLLRDNRKRGESARVW